MIVETVKIINLEEFVMAWAHGKVPLGLIKIKYEDLHKAAQDYVDKSRGGEFFPGCEIVTEVDGMRKAD